MVSIRKFYNSKLTSGSRCGGTCCPSSTWKESCLSRFARVSACSFRDLSVLPFQCYDYCHPLMFPPGPGLEVCPRCHAPCRRNGGGSQGPWGGAPKGALRAEAEACREQWCMDRAEVGAEWAPQPALGGSGDRRWWRREHRRWVDHTCRGQIWSCGCAATLGHLSSVTASPWAPVSCLGSEEMTGPVS